MVAYRSGVRRAVVAAVAIAGAVPASPAFAAWSAEVSREPGRLKVTVLGDVEGGRAVYATCDTARNAMLALLVPSNDPGLSVTGMTLSFAFGDGRRWTSEAALYRYDNQFIAVGYRNANDVPAIVGALSTARASLAVGLTGATGQTRTWSADIGGAESAARRFLDNCFNTN
jgi:hypothetical protein